MNRTLLILGFGTLLLTGLGVWWNWQPNAAVTTDSTGDSIRAAELNAEKQKIIWDAEHITFKIETHFGKPFAQALSGRNADQLSTFFRDDFAGRVLNSFGGESRHVGIVSELRRNTDNVTHHRVDAEGVMRSLIGSLSDFEQIARARLRVLEIEMLDGDLGRWKTRLLITADGTSGSGGPITWESEHGVEFRLGEERKITDGRIIARWQVESEVLRNSRRPLMEEVTQQVGLDRLQLPDNWKLPIEFRNKYQFQMAVEDFDRDGYPDIAIASGERRPILLHSIEGRRFEDVADSMGLAPWEAPSTLVTWIDYDNDGFPDLLMGDRLYHNIEGRRFVDATAVSGLRLGYDPMGCTVADYDGDGRLDLYVLYQDSLYASPSGKEPWVGDNESGVENQLWRNEGGGRFRNVTATSGAGGGRRLTFAASWLFFDDDRFPDLYVANDFGKNVLLRNRGDGTFEEIAEKSGVADFSTSMGVASGDLDNDGRPEIYVANMYSKMGRRIIAHVCEDDYPPGIFAQIKGSCAGNRLYSLGHDGSRFRELSSEFGVNEVGWAYAPAMVDLDGDGWLDLYATTGFMSFDRHKPDG